MGERSERFRRGLSEFAVDSLRGARDQVASEVFLAGFQEAAAVSIGVVEFKVEDLLERIRRGQLLSDREQYLLAELTQLGVQMRTELERSYRSGQVPSGPAEIDSD